MLVNAHLNNGPHLLCWDMLWSPTIRAALLAGTPWLDVFCPGCKTSRAIDLRTLDRHPLGHAGAGPAMCLVPRLGADAEADGAVWEGRFPQQALNRVSLLFIIIHWTA